MGTMNVLKACSEANMVMVMVNPDWPQNKAMDEGCWSDVKYCKATQNWYSLSKTLAELEVFDYAKRSKLDLVTVCPSLVIGPVLQSTVNASSSVIVDFFKGDREVKSKIRSFVDVPNVVDALLLVHETSDAFGRYICDSHRRNIDQLKEWYPAYKYSNKFVRANNDPIFSSKKPEMLKG